MAISAARRRAVLSCPTMPTSTASTPYALRATRSWWARPQCATTTRGCWCARRPAATPRTNRGQAPSPIKVTVTERVELDARADFFTTGDAEKLVYCASRRVPDARSRLGPVATVVDGGQPVQMRTDQRGPRRAGRAAADGRGGRQGAHPVLDRQPRRRAAAGCRSFLRRRLSRPSVRERRSLPLEPRPARNPCRGPPDRRCGAAALRALASVSDRLIGTSQPARQHQQVGVVHGDGELSGCSPAPAAGACRRRSRRLSSRPLLALRRPPTR